MTYAIPRRDLPPRLREAMKKRCVITDGQMVLMLESDVCTVPVLASRGGLAVHRGVGDAMGAFVISQITSGLRLAVFESRRNAILAMRALARILPWTSTGNGVARVATTQKRARVQSIITRYGGWNKWASAIMAVGKSEVTP